MSARILVVLLLSMLFTACVARGGVYHQVLPGQTLYSISRSYNVDESYLARINGIDDPTRLQPGQQLYIPGADQVRRVPVTVPSSTTPTPTPTPTPNATPSTPVANARSLKPSTGTPVTIPVSPQSPAIVMAPAKEHSVPPPHVADKFIWPLKGKLVRRFGSKDHGALCKGLEISAAQGTPVVSAAAGKVIYSGDGISGYGNLIIVRHDDSFFTVYGFNRENLVSSGAFVSKGQQIARVGVPPKGGSARLYFEIRYGKKPVDPIFYLP